MDYSFIHQIEMEKLAIIKIIKENYMEYQKDVY